MVLLYMKKEYIMITQTQLADRLMMIQAAAERLRSRKAQMSRIKKASKRVSAVSRKVKPKKAQVTGFEDAGTNPNHYPDASKYAKEYYGQRYEDTTRWDNVGEHNDWN